MNTEALLRGSVILLCALALAAAGGAAPPRHAAETPGVEPQADLSWLSGWWSRETETARSEEIWTDADGALMTGMNRTVRADGRTNFEFLRIEFGPPAVYIAQPSGGAAVAFPLVEHGDQSALFSNPDHDFPTHIAYSRDGDVLTARIWGADGESQALEWRWTLHAE